MGSRLGEREHVGIDSDEHAIGLEMLQVSTVTTAEIDEWTLDLDATKRARQVAGFSEGDDLRQEGLGAAQVQLAKERSEDA